MSDASVTQPGSRALKLFIFFYFSTIGIFLPFLPLLLKNNGLSNWQIGILFSIGPLVVVTIKPAWGFVSDRLKTVKKLVIFQLLVTAFLSLLVFRLRSFELLLPALLLFNLFSYPIIPLTDSLSFGLFFICSVSYVSKLVPDRLRSSGQVLLSCFLGGLAGIAVSILGGMVMTGMGPRTLYTACTLVALASFCFYL
ncbi:MAG: MFS transporter, partial [Desulfocucumaceae bacterium]